MIPRIIHQIWVGDPMPAELAADRATWVAHHPDWEIWLWDEASLRWLQNHDLFNRAEEVTPHVGQFRSDIARYEILRLHGGVYVDCDMECRRPIDDLLDVQCFAGWETDGVWVNNAVIGSVPNHPLLSDLIDNLPARVATTQGERPNIMTGPHYLTPKAIDHDIVLHPSSAFYPYRWDQLDRIGEEFPDAYAVHHWANARKRKGVPRG